jgi:hypothetical protein
MDLSTENKPWIVNCGVGGWYAAGSRRLERSLNFHGFAGNTLIFDGYYPANSPTHEQYCYAFKIFAIEEAIRQGAKILLWLDSSFWCVKTPHHIFDIIIDKGVFGFRTGYNLAQTCSDAALAWAGITRDFAETLPEIASGAVGLHLDNPTAKAAYGHWKEGMECGLFQNSRTHDPNDSTDPRFTHARQDQSIWSLACHKAGIAPNDTDYCAYYGTGHDPEKVTFFINGL